MESNSFFFFLWSTNFCWDWPNTDPGYQTGTTYNKNDNSSKPFILAYLIELIGLFSDSPDYFKQIRNYKTNLNLNSAW